MRRSTLTLFWYSVILSSWFKNNSSSSESSSTSSPFLYLWNVIKIRVFTKRKNLPQIYWDEIFHVFLTKQPKFHKFSLKPKKYFRRVLWMILCHKTFCISSIYNWQEANLFWFSSTSQCISTKRKIWRFDWQNSWLLLVGMKILFSGGEMRETWDLAEWISVNLSENNFQTFVF